VTYSTLDDARSYFGTDFEARLVDHVVADREVAKLVADGEGEHILDAVRELASFQQLRRLAARKLRSRGAKLGDIQLTAIEYLYGIRRLGPASWGSFENHVNRRHRVGRNRVGRQLEALEDAGVTRTTVDRDTDNVTVELVLAGVKRAPGSAPRDRSPRFSNHAPDAWIDDEAHCELCGSGDILRQVDDPEGRTLTVCPTCASRVEDEVDAAVGDVVLVGQPRPEGRGVQALKLGDRVESWRTGAGQPHVEGTLVEWVDDLVTIELADGSEVRRSRRNVMHVADPTETTAAAAGYCACEAPAIDVEHDAGCRRCGRPVDFSPQRAAALEAIAVGLRSVPVDEPADWEDPDYDAAQRPELAGHELDKSTGIHGGVAGNCAKCGARIAWSSTGSPNGHPRFVTVDTLSPTCPGGADRRDLAELEHELVTGTHRMSDTEFSVKAERYRQAGGYWPRGVADWTTPAGRELAARIREARS